MKILVSCFTYYPSSNGVQSVTQYQAEGLVQLGHEVTVLTGFRYGFREKITLPSISEHKGVKIRRFDAFTDLSFHFGNKKEYQKLLINVSNQYDVILFVCPESWCTDWALPILDKLSCASMTMVHGIADTRWNGFPDKSAYGIFRKIEQNLRWPLFYNLSWKYIRMFDAVAQLHEMDFGYQYFEKHGVEGQYILYNAVDERFFEESKKNPQVVNVGTFSPRKNQNKSLVSFYKSNLVNWKLILIGQKKNDYYYNMLKLRDSLEQKYGHRDVEILVGIPREKTIELIRESSIYLLTSISEMFPVSLLEGMAASCAFISTDVGIDKYLPGGAIANTPDEIAIELNRIAFSERLIHEMGKDGKRFVYDNCRKEFLVEKLEHIMETAIKRHKGL